MIGVQGKDLRLLITKRLFYFVIPIEESKSSYSDTLTPQIVAQLAMFNPFTFQLQPLATAFYNEKNVNKQLVRIKQWRAEKKRLKLENLTHLTTDANDTDEKETKTKNKRNRLAKDTISNT